MQTRSVTVPRRARSLLAGLALASVALGATAACGSDDAKGDRERPKVDSLVLTSQDSPENMLVPLPADQIGQGVASMGSVAEGAQVTPPECGDLSRATSEAGDPENTAVSNGRLGDVPVAVTVTTATEGIERNARFADSCPEVTTRVPMQQASVDVTSHNSRLDVPAPAGVEHYTAAYQDSTSTMSGTDSPAGFEQHTATIKITGVLDGYGIDVTATGANGPLPQEARDAAVALFARQAEKVRGA